MNKKTSAYSILIVFLLLNMGQVKSYADTEDTSTKAYKKQYIFTKNWFTHKIAVWTEILKEFKGKPNITYLEIGTFEGRSALWVLENILTNPTAKITVIDAFEEGTLQRFRSNINLSGEASKFKILAGLSTEKIKEVPLNSIDFAYIDGSGKGIVMLSDLVNTWNVVKVGGVMICSRYALDAELRKALELQPNDSGPYEAIDAFLKVYKSYIKLLVFEENQVIVRKIRQ
ncbi:MAG TPA: class I SAM-dependent methyltransferase [Hyphomicrobiales bacterium]|nr:class I SAM-dependent methyltransferase [Hyphomicrobiales bacterium]